MPFALWVCMLLVLKLFCRADVKQLHIHLTSPWNAIGVVVSTGHHGQVLFEAQGRGGKNKAVDLEDMKFHQCVRLARFENDRTISFIPPDGAFDLMCAPSFAASLFRQCACAQEMHVVVLRRLCVRFY